MPIAIHNQPKSRRNRREEIRQIQEEPTLSKFVAQLRHNVARRTFFSVQSLKVSTEHDRVTLNGLCESYYIKQLAQQAVLDMTSDEEIVNNIDVI